MQIRNGASPGVPAPISLIKGQARSTVSVHSMSKDQMHIGGEIGRNEDPEPDFVELGKPGQWMLWTFSLNPGQVLPVVHLNFVT